MEPLSPANLPSDRRNRERPTLGLRLLLTGLLVLPLAACDDGSPSKADLMKVIANEGRAQNPLMRNFSDEIVLKGKEVTGKTCKAGSNGMYQCSVTVDVMGQERTLMGVFVKRDGVWSELSVM